MRLGAPGAQHEPRFEGVLTDENGLARGVSFFDASSKQHYEVESRAVVLAASTVESGRMMLNSKSHHHPNGIGNSSGLIGHYLMDSTKSGAMSGPTSVSRGSHWTGISGSAPAK